jgi:galactonate dehydratase
MAATLPLRRVRLQSLIAAQTAAATTSAPGSSPTISAVEGWNVRQPKDGRVWSVIRIATNNGIEGWGEARPLTRDRFLQLRQALTGQPVHALESLRTRLDAERGWAAANSALLDIAAKAANAPVYQFLGGPTRFKVRAYTALGGTTNDELLSALESARKAGFRAFSIPVPTPPFRNSGKALVNATLERYETVRKAAGDTCDLIVAGGSRLTAGDAQTIAAALEHHHPLWFDEPCNTTSLGPVAKIASESVMPLAFGYQATDAAYFQNLLGENAIDLVRPELSTFGMSGIRKIAALAEVYYVAVSPRHGEGPGSTAAALHLAAAIPNFFIQHIPYPPNVEDREMRAALTGGDVESVQDGFVPLRNQPGLGVTMRPQALSQYGESIA